MPPILALVFSLRPTLRIGCPGALHGVRALPPPARSCGPLYRERFSLGEAQPLRFPLVECRIYPGDLLARGGRIGPPPAPCQHRPIGGLCAGTIAPDVQEHTHQRLRLGEVIAMLLDQPLAILLMVGPLATRARRDGRE